MEKPRQVIRTELLDDIEDERFIIFEAPRGYGKTYTARQLIDRITDRPCLYFTPLPWEKTFKQFATRFIEELRRTLGSEYLQFTYTLLESETATTDIIINRFTRELLDVRTKLQIIIDDFNLLGDEVQQFIMTMLLFVPENIDISICSRKKISYKLPRSLRKEIKIVSEEELVFSEDEATELLTDYRETDEIEASYEATGGWPLGLDLVKRAKFKATGDAPVSSSNILELRKLFEEEVFAPLSESTRDFLLKTSLLPYFDFNLVRSLFGEAGTDTLDKLILENLFVEETERGHYRYYQPFSDFLKEKAELLLAEEGRSEFQSQAGIALIELNRQDEGFRFLGHSEDWEAYSQAVIDNLLWFEGAVTSKYRVEFGGKLPTQICERYPGLAYLRAIYEFFQGKSEEAFRLLNLHLKNAELNDDLKARFLTYSYICTLQLNEEKLSEEIIANIERALQESGSNTEEDTISYRLNRAILTFALSKAAYNTADYERQKQLLTKASEIIGEVDNFIYYSIVRDQLDNLDDYSDKRESRLIEIVERLPNEAADIKSEYIYLLLSLLLRRDEIEKGERLLGELSELNKDSSIYYQIVKYDAERIVSIANGDINRLVKILEDGIRVLTFSPRQAMVHDWRGDYILTLIVAGEVDKATGYFERNYGGLGKPDYPRSRVRLLSANLALLAFNVDKKGIDRAIAGLKDIEIEHLKGLDVQLYTVIRLVHSFVLGNKENIASYALELNELPEPKISITPYILNRVIELYPGLSGIISDGIKPGPAVDTSVINVTLFGDITISGPNGKLYYGDFRYGKSAELLALLIMNRKKTLSSEQAIYELWGETDETKGRRRLNIAVHHLRKELASIGVTDLVLRKRGTIGIEPDAPIEIDAVAFEDKVSSAELLLAEGKKDRAFSNLKGAIELYPGDFLSNIYGEWCSRWFHFYRLKYEQALEKALEVSADLGYKGKFAKLVNKASADEDIKQSLEDKIKRLSEELDISVEINRE